jgi:uncharacterized membrane-anchored protein
MNRPLAGLLGACLLVVTSLAGGARADGTAEPKADEPPPLHWVSGPTSIPLGHELTLNLPASDIYLGGDEAKHLLEKNGTLHNENLLGIVAGTGEDSDWLVTFRYAEDGYVKDDEKIDADAILTSIKEGTVEDNKERAEKGFDPLSINGWRELPRYDRAQHHLVWGLDVANAKHVSVNYSTRILGRKGWVALNLLSSPEHLDANKPAVQELLNTTTFNKGSRYEDYQAGKDKVAEYGLAGLVLGGVGLAALKVAKVGLIAKFWNVILVGLLAAKKAVILAVMAVVAFFKKLFRKKEQVPAAALPVAPPGDPGSS